MKDNSNGIDCLEAQLTVAEKLIAALRTQLHDSHEEVQRLKVQLAEEPTKTRVTKRLVLLVTELTKAIGPYAAEAAVMREALQECDGQQVHSVKCNVTRIPGVDLCNCNCGTAATERKIKAALSTALAERGRLIADVVEKLRNDRRELDKLLEYTDSMAESKWDRKKFEALCATREDAAWATWSALAALDAKEEPQ